ncbi:MAG: carbohydrate kinase family protein [Bacillota bacterium]
MTQNFNSKTLSSTQSDLLLIGEALVDVFIDYQHNTHILFGGSPANICINTKQLGLRPMLCSSIGNDDNGNFLMDKLKQHNIDTSLIFRCDQETSKVMVNQTDASPVPTFYRGCDHNIPLTDSLIQAVMNTKVFHFSYWPLTKNPSKNTVIQLIKHAKKNDVIISFDPNIHKALLTDTSINESELLSVLKQVDIIKPSLDDAARLFELEMTKEAYMDKFEDLGIDLIMMTLGKDGVYVSNKKQRSHYPTYAKKIIDSTGAGDAFWSGFYGGYLNHYNLEDSIMLAQIASGFALRQIGAITDLPRIDELAQYMTKDVQK